MTPDLATLYDAIDATWPAAKTSTAGPWTIREGRGGGSRVNAATLTGEVFDIDDAVTAMAALGQEPIFMIRRGQEVLDAVLEARGYVIKDPVNLFLAQIAQLAMHRPPPVTTFGGQVGVLTLWKSPP